MTLPLPRLDARLDSPSSAKLGALLLEIYRAGHHGAAGFHRACFEILNRRLPFEAASWSVSAATPVGAVAHFAQRFGATDWNLDQPSRPRPGAHRSRSECGQSLVVTHADRELGVHMSLALFRSSWVPAFEAADGLLLEALLPHLDQALCIHSSWQIAKPTSVAAVGLADAAGTLYSGSAALVALLREEWPQWVGPYLPFCHELSRDSRFLGRRITLRWEPHEQGLRLIGRRRSPIDELTARERTVSEAFSSGLSNVEIARLLGIAPVTVRNHLKNIYAKLQVSNKIELLRELEAD